MLSNVKSFADVASVYEVNAVFPLMLTSNAWSPVKLTVVKAGAAVAVTSPPLPVTVTDVSLVKEEVKASSCAVLVSFSKAATVVELFDGSLSLMYVTLNVANQQQQIRLQ